jgi:RimJ/RimL family protein N-acetyltransferase
MPPDTETDEDRTGEEDCIVELRDRTPVIVHHVRPRRRAALAEFVGWFTHDALEPQGSGLVRESAVVRAVLSGTGAEERGSLVMERVEDPTRVVGNAQYVRFPQDPGRAEVALRIADEFRGRGASALLLHELAQQARKAGVRWFTAVVAAENVVLRDVFLRAGYPYRIVCDGPVLLIELDIGNAVEPRAGGTPTRVGRIVPAG